MARRTKVFNSLDASANQARMELQEAKKLKPLPESHSVRQGRRDFNMEDDFNEIF